MNFLKRLVERLEREEKRIKNINNYLRDLGFIPENLNWKDKAIILFEFGRFTEEAQKKTNVSGSKK